MTQTDGQVSLNNPQSPQTPAGGGSAAGVGTQTPTTNSTGNQSSPNVGPQKVKKGSQIGVRGFLIGCGAFILLFLGILVLSLFSVINNPGVLSSLGLQEETVKSLLQVFSILFFGTLFFISFFILAINGYRLATLPQGKIKHGISAAIGFLILVSSLGFGSYSLLSISKLGGVKTINSTNLVVGYLELGNDETIMLETGVPVIAPANIIFRLNTEIYKNQIQPKVGNNQLSYLRLDCGNGQEAIQAASSIFTQDDRFSGKCLYQQKGSYPIEIQYGYIDRNTGEEVPNKLLVTSVNIPTQVTLKLNDGNYTLNDKKDEILVGGAPAKIQINAQSVFTDLGLKENKINWDTNNDEQVDIQDRANISLNLNEPKLHSIVYSLPSLGSAFGKVQYKIDLRVEEAKILGCSLSYSKNPSGRSYTFEGKFDSDKFPVGVNRYVFEIIDSQTKQTIHTASMPRPAFAYELKAGTKYIVNMSYSNEEGRNECVTPEIDLLHDKVFLEYVLSGKGVNEENSKELFSSLKSDGELNSGVIVDRIPYILQLDVKKLVPASEGSKLRVSYADQGVNPSSQNYYEIKIDKAQNAALLIEVLDNNTVTFSQSLDINVKQKAVIAVLNAQPGVGSEPLEVTLDASTSLLNDPEDEIVFFTWDFGDDSEVFQNTSQGKLTHTYNFDKSTQNGSFTAKVTVETKKGNKDTAEAKILVKRKIQEANISLEAPHTNQIARAGDTVSMNIEADGNIKSINWDFGDEKTVSGEGRSSVSVKHTYEKAGTYSIKAVVSYNDAPAVTANISLKVIQ